MSEAEKLEKLLRLRNEMDAAYQRLTEVPSRARDSILWEVTRQYEQLWLELFEAKPGAWTERVALGWGRKDDDDGE